VKKARAMVKRYQGENEIIPEMHGACSSLNGIVECEPNG
jgi:hypothetical protein